MLSQPQCQQMIIDYKEIIKVEKPLHALPYVHLDSLRLTCLSVICAFAAVTNQKKPTVKRDDAYQFIRCHDNNSPP